MTASLGMPESAADPSVAGVPVAPVVPSRGRLRPLGLTETTVTGGYLHHRQSVNAARTLDHIQRSLEREGWLANFDRVAAGGDQRGRRGREFADSEAYKMLEAMAWELGRRPDPELERRFTDVVARLAAAQDPDGYLNTAFGHTGQAPRWSDLEWGHELYCIGFLLQAAVARARTGRPDDLLVRTARRAADLVCDVFGPAGPRPDDVCGHPEIELALAELARATQEPRYLAQATAFVERRGHGRLADIELGREYFQDDAPIRSAEVFRGHAVRANYLGAGAVDVAVETGDDDLLAAVARAWDRTVARRTYVTGGQGSRHQDEGYGDDFCLPADRAYSETCAAVAAIMLSWRLLLATGEVRHADFIERALYNVVLTSAAPDGTSFFYANTLHQRVAAPAPEPEVASPRAESSLRAPWFHVSCCPPNVARTLASLDAYVATADDRGLQLHQYLSGTVATTVPDVGRIRLSVDSDYPRDGGVVVHVQEAPPGPWELTLRVPSWCLSATLTGPDGASRSVDPGWVTVTGPATGEQVRLDLDVVPRFVVADPRVDAVRGCVAVQRGPEVWCLESRDLPTPTPEADLDRVRVDPTVPPWEKDGRVVVRAGLVVPPKATNGWPYAGALPTEVVESDVDLSLVPYHDWATRGPSTMRVWVPVVTTPATDPGAL